ncbi:MAG: hypothetical protein ACE5PV_18900 [Candidatus Poribacteria bacterium]
MRMEKYETYVVFRWGTEEPWSWTLCVIDDFWEEACYWFEEVGYPFESQAIEKQRKRIGRKLVDSPQRISIGCLPVYCEKLSDLNCLVIGDFPRAGKRSCIDWILEDVFDTNPNVAFLIDLQDLGAESKQEDVPEIGIINRLLRENISIWRCAFLTVGGFHPQFDLEMIIKGEVVRDEGEPLREWWYRMRGEIDPTFFDIKATRFHDPIDLEEKVFRDENLYADFITFVQAQAKLDYYGVWDWVAQRVCNKDNITREDMYAYLCGKTFLKFRDKSCFPFTALRGLFSGQCYRQNAAIVEHPAEIPQGKAINYPLCFGCYSAGNANFNEFAKALRSWLEGLEPDSEGPVRLRKVQIDRRDDSCDVTFCFTGSLPTRIFDDTDTNLSADSLPPGVVTKSWTKLTQSFGSENQPIVAEDCTEVTLRFKPCTFS